MAFSRSRTTVRPDRTPRTSPAGTACGPSRARSFAALALGASIGERRLCGQSGGLLSFVSALWFVVEAAIMLLPQPYGWVGVIGVAVGATLVVAYWGIWWQRHREYFSPDGPPAGWSPDLGPLRWFAVGMVAIALIFILAAVAMGIFHR